MVEKGKSQHEDNPWSEWSLLLPSLSFLREEEEEQVFIASAKGRNGPKDPYTPERDIRKYPYQRYIHRE